MYGPCRCCAYGARERGGIVRRQLAALSTGKKVAIGIAVAIGAPIFIAGAISGAKDSLGNHPAASAAPQTAPSTAPVKSSPTPHARPAVAIDQDGDPGTPCAMTYVPNSDRTGTITRFTIRQAGELITHLDGPNGLARQDKAVTPGTIPFSYDFPLTKITGAGAILQIGDARHVCSIKPAP